ncbi:hypothetical protein DPMN_037623 [Dreissena polymorpha]|uniref:Uncharacterized protein n=1 Tax=Dreissena polymorpha TaxID=45954 RepID=A0A9D4RMH5_DREPO|nr:hypothetical protein DPMN_037623 [Dreissena polymorpha]
MNNNEKKKMTTKRPIGFMPTRIIPFGGYRRWSKASSPGLCCVEDKRQVPPPICTVHRFQTIKSVNVII